MKATSFLLPVNCSSAHPQTDKQVIGPHPIYILLMLSIITQSQLQLTDDGPRAGVSVFADLYPVAWVEAQGRGPRQARHRSAAMIPWADHLKPLRFSFYFSSGGEGVVLETPVRMMR